MPSIKTTIPRGRAEYKEVSGNMDEILYPCGVDSAKVIMVIETTSARGSGEPKQSSRIVTQYWSLDGKLLAERDPY